MAQKRITVEQAVAKIHSGMTIMFGGFLANGSANRIIDALAKSDVKDITLICNDTAYADKGVGKLFARKQVKKVIASYVGANELHQQQMNANEIVTELVPQGTLAERVRAGGCGMGGFLTPVGLGTVVEKGKQKMMVDGKEYLLENRCALTWHSSVLVRATKVAISCTMAPVRTSIR